MSDTQRIDKWLWHARIARTRTAAASLVDAGHVRINRVRIDKPSRAVRPGDILTVSLRARVLVVRVLAFSERRGPAVEATALYEDLTPPEPAPPAAPVAGRGAGTGRPTKRDRRRIDAWNAVPETPDNEQI